ncbi:MAG: Trm112 family protein [Actinomycetota bacterium]
MPVDQRLLDILICPNCHGEVSYDAARDVIECKGDCKYVYPVRDDIPVMLIDEAQKP